VVVFGIALLGLHAVGADLLLAIPMYLFLLYVTLSLVVKRLHDRHKSAWWVIPFYFLPSLLERLSDRMVDGTTLQSLLIAASSALGLWAFIELGFFKGTAGLNQYGPDPLATAG
jgi:uncharacterized membrane protein YhaH (DUF805 family)